MSHQCYDEYPTVERDGMLAFDEACSSDLIVSWSCFERDQEVFERTARPHESDACLPIGVCYRDEHEWVVVQFIPDRPSQTSRYSGMQPWYHMVQYIFDRYRELEREHHLR